MNLCHCSVVAAAAAAVSLSLGCARAQPAATAPTQADVQAHHHARHHHHHHDRGLRAAEADRCPALIPGAWFTAQDTPDGAQITYGTDTPAYVRALRDAAHHQAQASELRAAAASLSNTQIDLPPVTTTIEYTADGAIVTYRALDRKNVERVRLLVHWDAAAQRLGNCSVLKVPPESMAGNRGRATMVGRASGAGTGEWITYVEIDRELGATCGLAPDQLSFAFDSTEARPRAFPVLRELARCLHHGPIAGMTLKVIGYFSPDSDDPYKDQTGVSRAEAIAYSLNSHGATREEVIVYPKGDPKSPGTHEKMRAPSRAVVIKRGP